MSQHDMEITTADANTGPTMRAALNAALQALASNNEGLTEPDVKYPNQWWPDRTAGRLKRRNNANTGWIDCGPLDKSLLEIFLTSASFTAGGTANAMTGTLNPAITAYTDKMRVSCTPPAGNSVTAPTLSLNGLVAVTVKKRDVNGVAVELSDNDYNASGPFDFQYDASGPHWVLVNPITTRAEAHFSTFRYVATAGQTTFTGADADASTLAYVPGSVLVFYRGFQLPNPDFTATNGTSVVLGEAAEAGHEVVIVAFAAFDVANTYTKAEVDARDLAGMDPYGFYKRESGSVAFVKTGSSTISIKAGTGIMVASTRVKITADTAVVMPALSAGTDYAIYACTDGTVRANASFTAPTGYTTETSRLIGGFHYGLVAPGTTVASGSFATTGNGMIWTQTDVNLIAGINAWSIWDLKWRTAANDLRGQKGFAFIYERGEWLACYLASTNIEANGLSRAGTNIASGTVLPKKPTAFGGNGTITYTAGDWWSFNELASLFGCKLPRESLFVVGAFGVTEDQSIDSTSATYPTTQRNAGYTSKYGIEQASGHHWTWGEDASAYQDVTGANTYKNVNGGRGQIHTFGTHGLVRVILGGYRTNGVYSGSHCSNWLYYPWSSTWNIGLRAACGHLKAV